MHTFTRAPQTIHYPVPTNPLPREYPEVSYGCTVFHMLFGGLIPFGLVFIEVFLIMTSVWLNQFYYAFFFLIVVLVITMVACAEISIVLCYFQLCQQVIIIV